MVPNLYPALTPEAALEDGDDAGARDEENARGGASGGAEWSQSARGPTNSELFIARPARGAHEVIVNGPQSVCSLADLPAAQVAVAVEVWRERMRAHEDAAYVQLIVNERREAGASLPHTHAQLYALDFVPADVARERERAGAYTTRTMGHSLLEDVIAEEVRRRERIVAIDDQCCAAGAVRLAAAVCS